MAVGGVGRGRGPKGPGGAKGPSGAAGTGKAFRVEGAEGAGKAESLVGASRASGTAEAAGVDPVTTSLQQIAKDLAAGKISSKSEATKQAVKTILEKRGLLGKNPKSNKKMVETIADTLTDDPRLAAALERTWARAGNK